jgi:hypothetical protein
MPENGEKNTTFGVYKSVCCALEIVIAAGAVFPDCPNHLHLPTQWKLTGDALAEIPHASQLAPHNKKFPAA